MNYEFSGQILRPLPSAPLLRMTAPEIVFICLSALPIGAIVAIVAMEESAGYGFSMGFRVVP
jgi:hypothetical protein